jgi:carboxypeptidase Taq
MIKTFEEYLTYLREIADMSAAVANMMWDKEVYMPAKGAEARSRQIALFQGMIHEKAIDEKYGAALHNLHKDTSLTPDQKICVQRSIEDYDQAVKLDKQFVVKSSRIISEAFHSWQKARHANDFELFFPSLQQVVAIKREEADLRGYENLPYDALLDTYEKGMTVKMLDPIFDDVQKRLLPIVRKIHGQDQPSTSFLTKEYDKSRQWDFSIRVLQDIGYDFDGGRQDYAPHPFTIRISPGDVRVTTRVDEEDFRTLLWSTIHEGGHALYEQGLPVDHWGSPLGSAASLAIHESLSRLWENQVARSRAFWTHYFPSLKILFGEALKGVTIDAFYSAINKVTPDYIRTEADELNYHFHILIRYELEKKLINGELAVGDLRDAWNEAYKHYLGLETPDDNHGVLQDIHWAHGSFGYFPTYSLGSFYAAQFFEAAMSTIPDLRYKIKCGEFGELLAWLKEMIFRRGRKYLSEQLCEKVTGEKLSLDPFMNYVEKKYGKIYDLSD